MERLLVYNFFIVNQTEKQMSSYEQIESWVDNPLLWEGLGPDAFYQKNMTNEEFYKILNEKERILGKHIENKDYEAIGKFMYDMLMDYVDRCKN